MHFKLSQPPIIPPPVNHKTTLTVPLNQLLERNAHLLLDNARVVHVPGNCEQFGAPVVRAPEAGEPVSAPPHNSRANRHSLDVRNSRRAAIEPGASRERRLEPRLARLPLERLDEALTLKTARLPSPRRKCRRPRRSADTRRSCSPSRRRSSR